MAKGKGRGKSTKGRGRKAKGGGRNRGRSGGFGGPGAASLHRAICAVTDPFCPAARGARYPDGNANRTLGVQARAFVQIPTNNIGCGVFVFTPGAPYTYTYGSPAAGATSGTLPSTYVEVSPGFAGWITSIAQQWRIVSAGVEITPLTNQMTATGVMVAQELPDQFLLDEPYNCSVAYSAPLGDSMDTLFLPLAQAKPFTWTARPGGVQSRQFQVFTPNTGDSSYDWTRLRVLISGAPGSTSVLQVQMVVNYEVVLTGGVASAQLSRPAPPMNQTLISASQMVQSAAGGLKTGAAQAVEDRVKKSASTALTKLGYWAADKALTRAGQAVGGYFGGPAGAIAGGMAGHAMMIEDVD